MTNTKNELLAMEPLQWRGQELFIRKDASEIKHESVMCSCWLDSQDAANARHLSPDFDDDDDAPSVFVTVKEDGYLTIYMVEVPIVFAGGDILLILKKLAKQRAT